MKSAIPLLLLAALAQEARKEPAVPPDRLPTVGTVVPLPKAAESRTIVEIEVDAKGGISVAGKAFTMEALGKHLQESSARPGRTGETYVVLRLDRDLPWQAAEWVVAAALDPKCRVYWTAIAVHPEGTEDAEAVAAFPRIEGGSPGKEAVAALAPVDVKLAYDETEIPVVPADLHPFLRSRHKELDGRGTAFGIEAAGNVPTGDVLAAADAAIRHGARSVLLRGSRRPPPKDLPAAIAALPARKGGLVLTVLGTRVLPPARDAPRLPAVVLVDGRAPLPRDFAFHMENIEEEIEIEGPPREPGSAPPREPR